MRDSISNEPLGYASVVLPSTGRGVVADENGIFEITVPETAKVLQVSCVGYRRKDVKLKRTQLNMFAVYLSPETTQLREVVVGKSKYSKKNNPAVDFLNRLKSKANSIDPLRNDYYSFDRYERITMGLDNFTTEGNSLVSQFPFLIEHVDTSEISGKPYLTLMVKEKNSRQNYRRKPSAQREIVDGQRSVGIDEITSHATIGTFIDDALPEIDLYQNDITLLQNRFVSPLSRVAADFYKFYLTDTITMGDERLIVLSFYPHNHAVFGFMGHVYVPEGDSTMFIRRVEMYTPRDINLNFIDNLSISQTYERAADGSRLKTADDIAVELSVAGKGAMFMRRTSRYANHSFEPIADSIFEGGGKVVANRGSAKRDSIYWDHARLSAISRGERKADQLMPRLRQNKLFYWGEKVIHTLFSGYITTGNPSPFDIGPVNAMMSYNTVEGLRLRAGGMTMAQLSPRWFGRFYAAYGFRDHRWKYGVEAEYSFIDKEHHSREFPMQSLRLTSSYDIDHPGQDYLFTTPDNMVLSLKRMSDDRAVYTRLNKLEFIFETLDNFSVCAGVSNVWRESAPTMPLLDGYGNQIDHYTQNNVELTLRYAPGEKFYQARSYRFPVNLDVPAVTIKHTYAPKGVAGTRYGVNSTKLDIQKRWWMSAWGYLDTFVSGSHVWGSAPFLSLAIPTANLSYIIEPGSFALLNPMEFILSSCVSADITYWANGAILNYVPYVKNLKLREVFAFRGFWGNLSSSANPALHPELPQLPQGSNVERMNHGPYMEASVGIENIFKVLRVDYVWRLSYRDVPYEIDRHGVRIAVHVTF